VMPDNEGSREIVREIRELAATSVGPFKRPRPTQVPVPELAAV
jgi:hypothetical protein